MAVKRRSRKMAIQVQKRTFHIPSTIGRVASQREEFVFNAEVHWAFAAIAGFNAFFVGQEHPFNTLRVDANVPFPDGIIHEHVFVDINFLLRDFSGDIDDTYEGFLDVLLIADVG
jgi:hypothetical protein